MKPKFITCNYTNLYETKLNGRLNRDFVYMYSLCGIAQCGDIIINYTCPYNIAITDPFFKAHNITNVINVDYDLLTSPYHARVDAIKDLKPKFDGSNPNVETGWKNRCCEIMYGKFLWMEENLQQLEDDDYLFWIDAGLSSGTIIPRKYNTFEGKKEFYKIDNLQEMQLEYAHRHDTIFNKDFASKLEQYAGEQISLIVANHNQHGDNLGFEFFNTLQQWPIGGLFGGKKKMLVPFIQEFKRLADRVLGANELVKEEQIMAVILNAHPEWFKIFKFDTWYHADWEVYNPSMISFSDFFKNGISCI